MKTMALRASWSGVKAMARGDRANTSLPARLMHAFSWQMATSLVGRVGTFAVAVMQARTLGKAGYGELGMVLSTLTLFNLFSNASGSETCTKFMAENLKVNPERAERIVALSLSTTLAMCSAAMLAVYLLGPVMAAKAINAPELARLFWLAGLAMGFQALTGSAAGILLGLRDFRLEGILRLAQIAAWVPLTVWLSPQLGTYGAMLAYTVSHGVGLVAFAAAAVVRCSQEGFTPRFRGMCAESRLLLHFSLPMMLNSLLFAPPCGSAMPFS